MSGEGGVRKRGGEVTDPLVSIIRRSPVPPPRRTDRKHLLQCSLQTLLPLTPRGHGQLERLPPPNRVPPVETLKTNSTYTSDASPPLGNSSCDKQA
ncbi:hypothetical protein PBY51_005970 [Eleginops maclovinus]|uniref:Uncharacterized protein n=1 Tax=Eleginops maclovinus TaxID=56733 RepID=A0AAN7WSS1_ELEMC|nr:hypothetical protein PBY51_005970 [Eleginops maclovinus]